jgi:hypothetical protein
MKPHHGKALLVVLSRLDRIETEIDAIIAESGAAITCRGLRTYAN